MKKVILNVATFVFVSFSLTSCGSSIESDAKKSAELACKAKKAATKGISSALSGDKSAMDETTKLTTEAASFAQEMQTKYTNPEDKQKFTTAFLKALNDCQ